MIVRREELTIERSLDLTLGTEGGAEVAERLLNALNRLFGHVLVERTREPRAARMRSIAARSSAPTSQETTLLLIVWFLVNGVSALLIRPVDRPSTRMNRVAPVGA